MTKSTVGKLFASQHSAGKYRLVEVKKWNHEKKTDGIACVHETHMNKGMFMESRKSLVSYQHI